MLIVPDPAAALALNVVEVLGQIGFAAKSGDAVGLAFTVSTLLDVAVQPDVVTVTVYVPAVDTLIPAVVAPVLHTYVPPPLAVNVDEPPAQID